MYRPSMYNKHDQTLGAFVDLFNNSSTLPNIIMKPNEIETYDNDGEIIDCLTNQSIGFDWEYRDRYFENCNFQFDSLGQFERKIVKPSIQLSIQCDSTETGIAVAWHEDWLREDKEKRNLSTDTIAELGTVRYTKSFKIYSNDDIHKFKKMLDKAFRNNTFNKNSF